jgi:hypothetical protein
LERQSIATKSGGNLTIEVVSAGRGSNLVRWEWRAADGYLLANGELTPEEAQEIGTALHRAGSWNAGTQTD